MKKILSMMIIFVLMPCISLATDVKIEEKIIDLSNVTSYVQNKLELINESEEGVRYILEVVPLKELGITEDEILEEISKVKSAISKNVLDVSKMKLEDIKLNMQSGNCQIFSSLGIPKFYSGEIDVCEPSLVKLYKIKPTTNFKYDKGNYYFGCYGVHSYITPETFTVKFDLNGGSGDFCDLVGLKSGDFLSNLKIPIRLGYIFDGWQLEDGTKWTYENIIKENITLFAKWIKQEFSSIGNNNYQTCTKDEKCPSYKYKDINPKEWYHDGVHYCIENNLIIGYPSNYYGPHDNLTRGQLVTILWRLEGAPIVNYKMTFEDVHENDFYLNAVRWCQSLGIVEGYNNEMFGPNDAITREQIAVIMWRYAKYKNYNVNIEDNNIFSYNDASTISEWAILAMEWLCGEGIIQGENNNLMAKAFTTRSQAAAIIQRFCVKMD